MKDPSPSGKSRLLWMIILFGATPLFTLCIAQQFRNRPAVITFKSLTLTAHGILNAKVEAIIPHGCYVTGASYENTKASPFYGSKSGDRTPIGGRWKSSFSAAWSLVGRPPPATTPDFSKVVQVHPGKTYSITEHTPLVLFDYVNGVGERRRGTIELRQQDSRIF